MSEPLATGDSKLSKKPKRRGAGRPRDSNSAETRVLIIDAARSCFAENGFRETTNQRIADRAGMTAGTIYHYFENKQSLYLQVHKHTQDVIMSKVLPCLEMETCRDAIDAMLKHFGELYRSHPEFAMFNATVRAEARRNPELIPEILNGNWRQIFHQLSDLAISTEEIDYRDARSFRNLLSIIVLGITQQSIETSPEDHLVGLKAVSRILREPVLRKSGKS